VAPAADPDGENGGLHLLFPMRYDSYMASPYDRRRTEGELLWPTQWDPASVAATESELGDYGTAGQFQQIPVPRGGGIISNDDWKIWPEWKPRPDDLVQRRDGTLFVPLPEVSYAILVLDTAISESETADYTACVVMGIWHRPRELVRRVASFGSDNVIDDGEQPRVILMAGWHMRGKLNDESMNAGGYRNGIVQRVIKTAQDYRVDEIIIEDKTRGRDVRDEIARQMQRRPFILSLFNPKKHGDKVGRLNAVQPLFARGLIYAPGNCVYKLNEGTGAPCVEVEELLWVRDIMNEVEQVPKGEHDDYADCISMGLLSLRGAGRLELTQEYLFSQIARRTYQGSRNTVRDGYGV